MTPFEARRSRKTSVQFLRMFSSMVHVKETRAGLKKLDDRSRPMIFVGYEPSTKGYRTYNPGSRQVHITRDAVFD